MSNRIKELRKQSGLTQEQIGLFLGIDQSMVAKIEKGDRALTTVQLSKLINLFACSEDYLLGNNTSDKMMKLAFRLENPTLETMRIVSAVNKVAANMNLLNNILERNRVKMNAV